MSRGVVSEAGRAAVRLVERAVRHRVDAALAPAPRRDPIVARALGDGRAAPAGREGPPQPAALTAFFTPEVQLGLVALAGVAIGAAVALGWVFARGGRCSR